MTERTATEALQAAGELPGTPPPEQEEVRRLRSRIAWLEGTAMPHARRQENANGFQKGWHAALSRVSERVESVEDLANLVPYPSADVDDTLPWPTPPLDGAAPAPEASHITLTRIVEAESRIIDLEQEIATLKAQTPSTDGAAPLRALVEQMRQEARSIYGASQRASQRADMLLTWADRWAAALTALPPVSPPQEVWIVCEFGGGGIRGVYPSQVAAEAGIQAIQADHPDLQRPDFVVQVERIRCSPPQEKP